MKKVVVVLSVLALVGVLFGGSVRADSADVNNLRVVSFQGQPQWHQPLILNAGDLVLELTVRDPWQFPEDFGGGYMCFHTSDGRTECSSHNMWEEVSEGVYRWEQYIPYGTLEIWFESYAAPITYEGFGPWSYDGYYDRLVKEQKTPVVAEPGTVEYRSWPGVGNPTWDWPLLVTPKWQQIPFTYTVKIGTNCVGENHGGAFEWEINPLDEVTFGNGVQRESVWDPLAPLTYTIQGPDGSVFWEGMTEGPWCEPEPEEESFSLFLPLLRS